MAQPRTTSKQGDAVYFDASTTHSYECTGDTAATALIVTLQHPLMQVGNGSRSVHMGNGKVRNAAAALLPAGVLKKKRRGDAVGPSRLS